MIEFDLRVARILKVIPEDAKVMVNASDALVEGDGHERVVKVVDANQDPPVEVIVSRNGYSERREVITSGWGTEEPLLIRLEKMPPFTNSVGMEFVLIPSGEFLMGSATPLASVESDDSPQHRVTLTSSYYMSAQEVTGRQWCQVTGDRYHDHRTPGHVVGTCAVARSS